MQQHDLAKFKQFHLFYAKSTRHQKGKKKTQFHDDVCWVSCMNSIVMTRHIKNLMLHTINFFILDQSYFINDKLVTYLKLILSTSITSTEEKWKKKLYLIFYILKFSYLWINMCNRHIAHSPFIHGKLLKMQYPFFFFNYDFDCCYMMNTESAQTFWMVVRKFCKTTYIIHYALFFFGFWKSSQWRNDKKFFKLQVDFYSYSWKVNVF